MANSQIKCISLKINEADILLPAAAVAEIVPIKNIINVANKPSWMLGYLDWRGNSVPLVAFETMGGVRMPSLASGSVKAAILFSIGEDRQFPFISILVQGAPGALSVKEDDIVPVAENIIHPAVEQRVMIGDATYSVISLENLESIVKTTMKR
jgi:chemosensory pili system protein ChpC